MKKTLALLLALCMVFSISSVAFAESSATLNVALVDDNGETVTEIKAGESVWAVISVANYENYVGEMEVNWEADDPVTESAYDKVISVATTYLELDTAVFAAATDDNGLVWESPYKSDIEGQGGEMSYNLDGNILKTLLKTDCDGGTSYSIGKSELDANNGELYRIKLVAADDAAVGAYSVGLYGGDGITAPGIATISSAAGEATVTTAEVPVAMGAAAPIAIYSDDVDEAVIAREAEIDLIDGYDAEYWAMRYSGVIKNDAVYGNYMFGEGGNHIGVYTNQAYDLSKGFHFSTTYGRYYTNTTEGNHVEVIVGPLSVKIAPKSIDTTFSSSDFVATVYNGEAVLATETGDYYSDLEFREQVGGNADLNRFCAVKMDYVDGVLTVVVNDVTVFSGAVEADLSAAIVKVQEIKGWANSYAYDVSLSKEVRESATYETLEEAVAAANDGDTITLINDVALDASLKIAKKITIDLNGNNITADFENAYGALYVAMAGDLTIVGEGTISNTDIAIGVYGALAVNGGTISGDYAAIYNFYYNASTYGNTAINGGAVNGWILNCGDMDVTGGTVEKIDNSGALAVEGGTVGYIYGRDGSDAAGVEGAGTIAIADASIIEAKEGFKVVDNGDGTYKIVHICVAGEAVTENEVAGTCTVDGSYDTVTYCTICGEELSRDTNVIPAVGEHILGGYVNNEDGTQTKSCPCGEVTETVTNAVGADITWTLEDGVLTLTGTGATFDYTNVGNVNPFIALRADIKEIVIGDGITHLGNRLFRGVTQVQKITFGKDVVSTGHETFYSCLKLTTVEFNEGFKELGSLAFYNCKKLNNVELPSTLTTINSRAFKLCVALTEIVIPDSVTYIGYEVFMGDTALANVTYSNNCSLISPYVFAQCTALTEFYVPKGVVRIRPMAFAESGLLSITFEDERTLCNGITDEPRISSNAFFGCSDELVMRSLTNGYLEHYATSHGKNFKFESIGVLGLDVMWVPGTYTEYVDFNLKQRDIECTLKDGVALYVVGDGVTAIINKGLYDGGDNGNTIGLLVEKNATAIVNGGTIKANGNRAALVVKTGAVAQLNGGFYAVDSGSRVLSNEGGTIIITGGTYVNYDPTEFVADGYTVTTETQANGDVWYTVVAQ